MAIDRLLDHPRSGPLFLAQQNIAEIVVNALLDGDRRFGRYILHSFVVMPNHVHMLVTPKVRASEWLRPLKGFTGHQALKLLNQRGQQFWQNESYDHLVRNDEEGERITRYIEWNPVKAGLVMVPEEFKWSSAARGGSPAAGPKP